MILLKVITFALTKPIPRPPATPCMNTRTLWAWTACASEGAYESETSLYVQLRTAPSPVSNKHFAIQTVSCFITYGTERVSS